MKRQLERIIVEVAETTCESLAFMFPMPPPEDGADPDADEDALGASVEFSGPFEGVLAVTVPRQMLPHLAANMLGLAPDCTTAEQRHDALRELCNVVCGNLLPAIAGPDPVFEVSPPQVADDARVRKPPSCVAVTNWFDAGWVHAHFLVDGGLQAIGNIHSSGARERFTA